MQTIETEVSGWPGIAVDSHRFGGREFTLGVTEIGHVHGERLVDIPFAKRIRDVLVAEGVAEKHHVYPESGWISYRLRDEEDAAHAIWLLRLSYLARVIGLKNRGTDDPDVAALDVENELDELGIEGDLRAIFTDLRAR